MALSLGNSYAQKYALIDMEYILKKIPSYENANKQLEALSQEWQKEVDTEVESVNAMYKKNIRPTWCFLPGMKRQNAKMKLWPKKMLFRSCVTNTLALRENCINRGKNLLSLYRIVYMKRLKIFH